jgi:hypothetical protein
MPAAKYLATFEKLACPAAAIELLRTEKMVVDAVTFLARRLVVADTLAEAVGYRSTSRRRTVDLPTPTGRRG